MAAIVDPEGREFEALQTAMDWQGTGVLEIGCGEGRLTLRLAQLGARVVAFDIDHSRIQAARRDWPEQWSTAAYHVGSAEQLGYGDGTFDAVVFAWSL